MIFCRERLQRCFLNLETETPYCLAIRARYISLFSLANLYDVIVDDIYDVYEGLEYLHKACSPPFVHRDVKTSNILLNENLEAKVSDFGLMKAFNHDDDTHVSTARMIGTPGYFAPE
jgi:serine/threonine protein kinase